MTNVQESLYDLVSSEGVGSMTFLLKKIDDSFFEHLENKNISLIDHCLQICCEEGTGESTSTDLLTTELIKRILVLYKEKNMAFNENFIEPVLNYCILHWESLVGTVSYNCVDIFSLILSNHSKYCEICRLRELCSVASNVIRTIVKSGSNSKARLKCIKILLESFNVDTDVNKSFLIEAYASLEYPNLSVAASELIEHDFCIKRNEYAFHLEQITKIFVENCVNSRNAVKDRLIPIILKSSNPPPNILMDIVLSLISSLRIAPPKNEKILQAGYPIENPQNFEALLIIVHHLIYKPPANEKAPTWLSFVDPHLAIQAMFEPSSQVRVAFWALLTDHPKKTQPFTALDFELMKVFLTVNSAEQSPTVRQKILSGFRNVLERLCESGENQRMETEENLQNLSEIAKFIKFVISLAFDCISIEANFSRRLMGLYLIEHIFASNFLETKQKKKVLKFLNLDEELTVERFNVLLSNLDNEYQLCQMITMKLLRTVYPKETSNFDFEKYNEETLELINSVRTQDTASSGYRLQYSLLNLPGSAVGLLKVLLERCQQNVLIIQDKLMNITTHFLHPLLNAISYLLEQRRSDIFKQDKAFLETYTNDLLKMCFQITEIVTPVVHSLSPEGFIPEEELEFLANTSNAQVQVVADKSQLLLACCWRAHKFVSSIFTNIINGDISLSAEIVEDISKYFWLQLTECKHCGAFESAVEGFYSLCSYLWKANNDNFPHPARWADEIILALEGKNDSQKLCSTRRSGGVPHLVISIMASEPLDFDGEKSIFAKVFDSLLNMDGKELEYRIHSLNVLKAIVSSSKLGDRMLFAIEKICVVSINACSAESWSERNAGAQLAAALRIRIFGVGRNSQKDHEVDSKNKLSAFDFFSRFPTLYKKLYDQLQVGANDDFKCYPILIFLSHLIPTFAEKFPLAPFIPACLNILFTTKSEKLRNLTSATVVSISQEQDFSMILKYAQECSETTQSEPVAHSVLILVHYCYKKLIKTKSHEEIVAELLPCLQPYFKQTKLCDYNLNIFYTLLNDLKIDFDPFISEHMKLTWRPIAVKNLKKKNVLPYLEEKPLRFEYYRTSEKISEFVGKDELLLKACSDLSECKIEREFSEVLSFLLNNLESKTEDFTEKLETILLDEKIFSSSKTWLLSRKLYYSLRKRLQVDNTDFSWLKKVSENDEDDSLKEIALELSELLLPLCKVPDFIAHVSLFLQDECEDIRKMSSQMLSNHYLRCNMALASEICLRLIMEDVEVRNCFNNFASQSQRKRNALFDACNSRPFSETKLFGDNHFITDFVLKNLKEGVWFRDESEK